MHLDQNISSQHKNTNQLQKQKGGTHQKQTTNHNKKLGHKGATEPNTKLQVNHQEALPTSTASIQKTLLDQSTGQRFTSLQALIAQT